MNRNAEHSTQNFENKKILSAANSGTALLMTILILNSVVLISLAAAKIIVAGVKESSTQSMSTKAYFAAEAGAERILYEYRKNSASNHCGINGYATTTCVFAKTLSGGSSYNVYWSSGTSDPGSTLIYISVGNYNGLKRSDELDFSY